MKRPTSAPLPPGHDILLHALGISERADGRAYRNYFVTDTGADLDACVALVAQGLMREARTPSFVPQEMRTFLVTEAGEVAARRSWCSSKPRLTRAQKRYRRWLDIADCCPDSTFGDFIKYPERFA